MTANDQTGKRILGSLRSADRQGISSAGTHRNVAVLVDAPCFQESRDPRSVSELAATSGPESRRRKARPSHSSTCRMNFGAPIDRAVAIHATRTVRLEHERVD